MATKFTRQSEVHDGIEARKTPWIRQRHFDHVLSRRQRLFIIMAATTALILLLQLATRLNRAAPFANQSAVRGVATVLEKSPAAPGAPDYGLVTLEIVPDGGATLAVEHAIPKEFWDDIEPGARIAVIYQVDQAGKEIRIVESGLVALPDNIR